MDGDLAKRRVVAVGASAGGVGALRALAGAMPADLPAAILVVLHVGRRSIGRARWASSSGGRARATLTIDDGRLRLARPSPPHGRRSPVDDFLCSLARDQGDCAAGVILSGTGSDGTVEARWRLKGAAPEQSLTLEWKEHVGRRGDAPVAQGVRNHIHRAELRLRPVRGACKGRPS